MVSIVVTMNNFIIEIASLPYRSSNGGTHLIENIGTTF
jgi:hypothetical protein